MPDSQRPRTIVLVGHCTPDLYMLNAALSRYVPGSTIAIVNDSEVLQDYLNDNSVLLVNRVLDGHFPTGSGVELIREICELEIKPLTILVSNLPEAQEQAVEAGAVQGFGKNALYDTQTAEILENAVYGHMDSAPEAS